MRRFRGSIARHWDSLSTLRSEGCPSPRKTRFRLLAKLCRAGFVHPQGSDERFLSFESRPPFLSFPGAMSVHISKGSAVSVQRLRGVSSYFGRDRNMNCSENLETELPLHLRTANAVAPGGSPGATSRGIRARPADQAASLSPTIS